MVAQDHVVSCVANCASDNTLTGSMGNDGEGKNYHEQAINSYKAKTADGIMMVTLHSQVLAT